MKEHERLLEIIKQLDSAETGTTLIMEGMIWTCYGRFGGYRAWKLNKMSDWPALKVAEYLLVWEDRYAWCMY